MRFVLPVLGLVTIALAGCQKAEEEMVTASSKAGTRGRYVGVGLYIPGQMWTQLARDAQQDPKAATLEDDEQVIVVIDTSTGELRQCGNLSGHCVALNPWKAAAQGVPAPLLKHARQLAEEENRRLSEEHGQPGH